jgi:hypothetical protein
MVAGMEKAKADLAPRNLEFVQEEIKLHGGLKAKVASPNVVRLDLRTMVLRDYGRPGGIPTLVNAPFAGHRAMIADYHKGQSLVETLLAGGVGHVALTDWKSAAEDMKDFDIDNYLEELIVAIDDLGGRVNRRNPERPDQEEARPRRTYRSLHGLAHAQGDVADDRARRLTHSSFT